MKRICDVLEVSRSNLYEQAKKSITGRKTRVMPKDGELLPVIRQITDERPIYGYRRVMAMLRKTLPQAVNPKRVYRLMKHHNLLLQKHGKRPMRLHDGKIITLKSNMRWCSDHFTSNVGMGSKFTWLLFWIVMTEKQSHGLRQIKALMER